MKGKSCHAGVFPLENWGRLMLIPVFLALYIGLIVLFKVSLENEIVMKALRKKFAQEAWEEPQKTRRRYLCIEM
jgi:hypothetical protein